MFVEALGRIFYLRYKTERRLYIVLVLIKDLGGCLKLYTLSSRTSIDRSDITITKLAAIRIHSFGKIFNSFKAKAGFTISCIVRRMYNRKRFTNQISRL